MKQGYPAREVAYTLILKSLIAQDQAHARFEELVNMLEGELSRGTIDKYLTELFESRGKFKGFVKREGRRGAYYVPEEKRGDVKLFLKREETKQHFNTLTGKVIDKATMKELGELRRALAELKQKVAFFDDPKVIEFLKRKLGE